MTTPTSLSSRSLYTIGWICALPLERTAATAALDIQHTRPRDFTQPRSDTNSYTWGSIGEHNVVIASAGEYGTASAARVAMIILSSFPEVRFGLMVGIGAGIPRQDRDIRLGDIVVSRPHGSSGGVVQYYFVKAIQNLVSSVTGGTFQRIGSLNSPPKVLLNAVSAIQAQHDLQPSRVPEFIDRMYTRFPKMAQSQQGQPGYIYQGAENDRLFEGTYKHMGGDCSQCEPSRQLPRVLRPLTEPWIHYGIIASGSTLVKDAATRALLVRQTGEDCICFETEAAGLMNQFPCLVIRGICDYADSHKNDSWQRYAAAVAAAYARELLEFVPVQDVRAAPSALDVVKSGGGGTIANGAGTGTAYGTNQQPPSGPAAAPNQQSASDLAALTNLVNSLASRVSLNEGAGGGSQQCLQGLRAQVTRLEGLVTQLSADVEQLAARVPAHLLTSGNAGSPSMPPASKPPESNPR